MSKKRLEWEVRKIKEGADKGKWGVFLCEKYWKYKDKPVCYGAAVTKKGAQAAVDRMNDPDYYME